LTIVSQIIEDHRGYIRAVPNHPRGTRFTIELPAGEADALDSAKKVLHS
jgi:signal transduction histidine kinase